MQQEYCVYVHINKINGKKYIGLSNNIARRWRDNGADYGNDTYFAHAIAKYGWDNFEHIILKEHLTKEEADYYEQFYIDYYQSKYNQNGYNIRDGGSRGALSESTKEKISLSRRQEHKWQGDSNPRHLDPLFGERNGMYGKEHTAETKQKISEANKGHKVPESARQKISEFMTTQHPRARRVICIETGEIFLSSRQAAKAMGVGNSSISRVCNGERKTCKKLHWKWYDDFNK